MLYFGLAVCILVFIVAFIMDRKASNTDDNSKKAPTVNPESPILAGDDNQGIRNLQEYYSEDPVINPIMNDELARLTYYAIRYGRGEVPEKNKSGFDLLIDYLKQISSDKEAQEAIKQLVFSLTDFRVQMGLTSNNPSDFHILMTNSKGTQLTLTKCMMERKYIFENSIPGWTL